MEIKLEKIILWLTKSGMVVNEAKTDLCLFSRYDCPPVILNVNGKYIISKKVINILGVSFDSKLQWCSHIAATSNKALKALNAIRIIKKKINKKEILELVTTNVFSILYYNSEIWHLPSLKTELKQKLMSVSARAISTCMYYPDRMISFENIYLFHHHHQNNKEILCNM